MLVMFNFISKQEWEKILSLSRLCISNEELLLRAIGQWCRLNVQDLDDDDESSKIFYSLQLTVLGPSFSLKIL